MSAISTCAAGSRSIRYIESWPGGDGHCCRLLVGMQGSRRMSCALRSASTRHDGELDNQTAVRLKNRLAEEFRDQLTIGIPTNDDEAGLRRLAAQIRAKKVVVKLFLRHPLHAKLYLLLCRIPSTRSSATSAAAT